MTIITKEYGKFELVTEKQAKTIKKYNALFISKKEAVKSKIRHKIEDRLMCEQSGITIDELNANRLSQ